MTQFKEVRTSQHEAGQEQRVASFKITQLIWWVLGLLEALLGLRFLFKLIGANPNNPFATFLYELTDFFVRPFATLTGTPTAGNMVFEFSTLITMIVYALIAWALERLFYVHFLSSAWTCKHQTDDRFRPGLPKSRRVAAKQQQPRPNTRIFNSWVSQTVNKQNVDMVFLD